MTFTNDYDVDRYTESDYDYFAVQGEQREIHRFHDLQQEAADREAAYLARQRIQAEREHLASAAAAPTDE